MRSYIWNENIRNESELLELCRKPLFLTMLVVAYQGRAISNSSELFEAYIEQQLNNPNNQGTYPPRKSPTQKQTLHYLVWLARKMEAERETEFLIEGIQPTWLESTKQKIFYRIILGLNVGLIVGLLFAFNHVLMFPIMGLISEFELIFILIFGPILMLIEGLIGSLVGVFIVGVTLIYEVLLGLIVNRNRIKLAAIKITEKNSYDFRKFFRNLLIGGMIGGLMVLPLLFVGSSIRLNSLLIMGLFAGLYFGFLFGLFGIFRSSEIESKNFPNSLIWKSLHNGLIVVLIFVLIFVLIGLLLGLFVGLNSNLIMGLFMGLIWGGFVGGIWGFIKGLNQGLRAAIRHFTLRLILYQNGDIPWNYAQFLDHAAKYRFIQRVGGRYRFIHDLLRKHFVQMPLS